MQPGSYRGPAGVAHDMSASFSQDNANLVPAESSGTTDTMNDMHVGDEYDDSAFYMQSFNSLDWNMDMNFGLGNNVLVYDDPIFGNNNEVYSNSGSEPRVAASNSAELAIIQGLQLGFSNGSIHVKSAGLSRTDDQNEGYSVHDEGKKVVDSSERDEHQSDYEEGKTELNYLRTPPDSSHNDESEQRAVAEPALALKQDEASVYPEEITADGAIDPYHMNGHPYAMYVGELADPSHANLYPGPHPVQHHLVSCQGAPSATLLQVSQDRPQGRTSNHHQHHMNSQPQGFMNNYPQRQDLNGGYYQGQQGPESGYTSHGPQQYFPSGDAQYMVAPRRPLPPTENGFGGPALVRQPLQQYDGSLMLARQELSNVNVSGGQALLGHTQGVAFPNNFAEPNTSVSFDGTVEAKAPVHCDNNGFVPLFLNEDEFLNRNAAREATRVRSDYPYNNPGAQQQIISRLYKAIRNTTDVEDSEKVAVKFMDGSISDDAIQETCWKVMLKCRDSQELKHLVPEYHHMKYIVKESFTERIESVIATLHKSKAACKQAMAPSFLARLADQPDEEMKRKTSNKILNMRKTGQNKAGQRAIEHNCADANGDWKGIPGAETATQAGPQQAGEPSRIRCKRGGDVVDGPAPKRARR